MDEAILRFFESIRNPFLSAVMGVFSLLGEAMFVGAVAILLFWLLPRRAGEQVVMTALTSFPLNSFVKFLVARPRPFAAGVVKYEEPFFADDLDPNASFPSGHTQSSASLFFSAASAAREKRRKILFAIAAAALSLLVMTARVYFGAHYPTDVLAGFGFAVLVALFWAIVFRYFRGARYFILLGFAALALIPCLFAPPHDYFQAAGLISGGAVALAFFAILPAREETFRIPRRLWRVPVGIAAAGAVFALTLLFPAGEGFTLLKWFSIAFAAGFFAPLLFRALKI